MYPRTAVPPALTELAACQAGVLTREQIIAYGLSKDVLARLTRSGGWHRLGRGVFSTRSGSPEWESLAWAGVLVGGDQARLGPEASGHLHGLVPLAPEPVDVLVPVGRTVRVRGPWRFVQERPRARSARVVGHRLDCRSPTRFSTWPPNAARGSWSTSSCAPQRSGW